MDNEPKFTVASLPMVAAGHVITCDNEFLTRVGLTNALSLSLVHAATEYQLKHKVYVVIYIQAHAMHEPAHYLRGSVALHNTS